MRTIVMRKNILYVSIILASLVFIGQSSAIDSQSFVGIWLFDDASGGIAIDSSGNGNDGALIGDPQWGVGKFGGALDLNGSTDYVEIADSDSLDITDAITVAAWLYRREHFLSDTLVGKWGQLGNSWSYALYVAPGDGWRLRWSDENQTNLTGYEDPPYEEWFHFAATYDGSDMKVYLNGAEIGAAAAENKEISVTDNPMWIGNNGYQEPFNGIIDEIVLLNVALTADEINAIMTEGVSATPSAVSPSGKMAFTWGNIKADH